MGRLTLIFLCLAILVPARAQVRDSSALADVPYDIPRAERFSPLQAVAPAVLFAAGAAGVDWDFYDRNINTPIKDYGDRLRSEYGASSLDNWLQYVPMAAYLGFGAIGKGGHRFMEHFVAGATSWAAMGILVNSIKYTVKDLRPDGSSRNSFPSGHSATAFMGAEMVRVEYGGWWGAGAYGIATAVALMRVYNGRHWFNDLLGGAAIGVLSAHIGYWMLPLERRWFGIRPGVEMAVVPYAIPSGMSSPPSFGLSAACSF